MAFYHYFSDRETVLDLTASNSFANDGVAVSALTPTISAGKATFTAPKIKELSHRRTFRVLALSSAAGAITVQHQLADGTVLADAVSVAANKSVILNPPLRVMPGEKLLFGSGGAARLELKVVEETNPVVL